MSAILAFAPGARTVLDVASGDVLVEIDPKSR
jgi:hypothetical protein